MVFTFNHKKKLLCALTKLYGVGTQRATQICQSLGFSPFLRVADLTIEQEFAITKKIKEEYKVEFALREEIKFDVQRYISNGSIRGFRLRSGLPVRGQRTHTNAKIARRLAHTRH